MTYLEELRQEGDLLATALDQQEQDEAEDLETEHLEAARDDLLRRLRGDPPIPPVKSLGGRPIVWAECPA